MDINRDEIRERRLANDYARLLKLEQRSEVFSFTVLEGEPPEKYLFSFTCPILTRNPRGEVQRDTGCDIGVYLPPTYPLLDSPLAIALHPKIWHPNIQAGGPICTGTPAPGLFLDAFVQQLYHILIWLNFTMHEASSLNPSAAAWARHAVGEGWFPTTRQPLVTLSETEETG